MVFVINSNVGFEALMYQKPVITFGKSHYRGKGVTLDVTDLYDLPEVIKRAETFKPSLDRVATLFFLWFKSSFPPPGLPIPDESLLGKNAIIYCDSLLKYLKMPGDKKSP